MFYKLVFIAHSLTLILKPFGLIREINILNSNDSTFSENKTGQHEQFRKYLI